MVSITYLDQDGYSCYLGNKSFKLFHDSSVIGTGTLSDGLYKIDLDFDFEKLINTIVEINERELLKHLQCLGIKD